MWSWLARMIGNRANAESCMMFAWHDKQFIDLHFWNESSANLPEFKDPTQYLADPSKAKPKAAGAVIKNAIRPQDITSLVWFYVEYMPVLTAMWVEVVTRYIRDHTRKQVAALHIKRPKAGGFRFNTAPWISNFFTHHFCGKHKSSHACTYVHVHNRVPCKPCVITHTALHIHTDILVVLASTGLTCGWVHSGQSASNRGCLTLQQRIGALEFRPYDHVV